MSVKFDDLPSKERKSRLDDRAHSPLKKPGQFKKTESVTFPVAKVTMDITDLFLGQTEIKTEYIHLFSFLE